MDFKPEHLIASDVERIVAKSTGSLVDFRIRTADKGVSKFTTPYFSRKQTDFPIWLAEGLEILSDGSYRSPWDPNASFHRGILTRDKVAASFRAQWDEALADEVEWWREDPNGYARARNLMNAPEEAPDHPWGDKVTQDCTMWLSFTPYRVWDAYNTVREAARAALDEELLACASGVGNPDRIKRLVEDGFNKAVREAVAEGH